MASKLAMLSRLESRAAAADQLIDFLRKEIADIKRFSSSNTNRTTEDEIKKLEADNKKLSQEIEQCKSKLTQLEISHGKTAVPLPSSTIVSHAVPIQLVEKKPQQPSAVPAATQSEAKGENKPITEPQAGGGKAKKVKKSQPAAKVVQKDDGDVTRLDLRVGLITSAERHPDADSLYIEHLDIGGETPLTVISGLAGRIALEDLRGRLVVLLCNLKPSKMRGIISQAMVMCASSPCGKVETLIPPPGSVPGDKVTLEGEEASQPDTQLKGKVWETVAAKLRTRDDLVAAFDGKPLVVPGKGLVMTASLTGVPIK